MGLVGLRLEQQLQRLAGQRRLAAGRRAPRVDGPVAGLDLEPPRRAGRAHVARRLLTINLGRGRRRRERESVVVGQLAVQRDRVAARDALAAGGAVEGRPVPRGLVLLGRQERRERLERQRGLAPLGGARDPAVVAVQRARRRLPGAALAGAVRALRPRARHRGRGPLRRQVVVDGRVAARAPRRRAPLEHREARELGGVRRREVDDVALGGVLGAQAVAQARRGRARHRRLAARPRRREGRHARERRDACDLRRRRRARGDAADRDAAARRADGARARRRGRRLRPLEAVAVALLRPAARPQGVQGRGRPRPADPGRQRPGPQLDEAARRLAAHAARRAVRLEDVARHRRPGGRRVGRAVVAAVRRRFGQATYAAADAAREARQRRGRDGAAVPAGSHGFSLAG